MEYERFVVAVLAVVVVVAGGRDARVVDAVLSMLVTGTLWVFGILVPCPMFHVCCEWCSIGICERGCFGKPIMLLSS